MKADALTQAQRRLRKAEAASQQLMDAMSIEETREAWSDFLLAASGIYIKLKRGVARTGLEAEWFEEILKEREQDEFLKYIYEARNVEEHGIVEATGGRGHSIMQEMPDGTFAGQFTDDTEGGVQIVSFGITLLNDDGTETPYEGPKTERHFTTLIDLHDDRTGRKGQVYPVPTKHLGSEISIQEPKWAAKMAISYLQNMMFVAENISSADDSRP